MYFGNLLHLFGFSSIAVDSDGEYTYLVYQLDVGICTRFEMHNYGVYNIGKLTQNLDLSVNMYNYFRIGSLVPNRDKCKMCQKQTPLQSSECNSSRKNSLSRQQ